MSSVVSRLWGVAPADESTGRWHVSARVDIVAYAFSWVFILVPMAFAGDVHQIDYPYAYLLVLAITETHRHFSYPYVYLDGQVFGRHRARFTVFPGVLLLFWVWSVYLARDGGELSLAFVGTLLAAVAAMVYVVNRDKPGSDFSPRMRQAVLAISALAVLGAYLAQDTTAEAATTVSVMSLLNGAAVFAGLWNIWHVYMQKYGILRMYNAKSSAEVKVPGWVDRALVVCWLPFYLFYLGPIWGAYALERFSRGQELLGPLFAFFEYASQVMVIPTGLLVVWVLFNWLRWEKRSNGLQNRARLWMFAGTTLLSASFLFFHPLKVYLAYAFSHSVEYCVFVWAFQRRRYRRPHAHGPVLGKLVRHPVMLYVIPTLLFCVATLYLKYYGRWFIADAEQPTALGIPTYEWFKYYTVYQSMIHFYFDGFLWKMRLPEVHREL